jgi:RHS repeat-associated protein
MSTPTTLSEQALATPSGAGAVRSAGDTFRPDPQTGTGQYDIPIPVQPGPAGIAPALSLSYSTHRGNSIAGLGFDLGLAVLQRRTDHGIPTYDDALDRFTLQGDELLAVGGGQYRLRVESRFARIRHVLGRGSDSWVVVERDGTRTFYGETSSARLSDGLSRVAAWHVTRKQDVHGNEVLYRYERDAETSEVRLVEVLWGAYRTLLTYEDRPDPVVSSRPGFRHTVAHRLKRVEVQVRRTDNGQFHTYHRLDLAYTVSRWTGRSLLSQVVPVGTDAAGSERQLPALSFGWVDPEDPAKPLWHEVAGDVPGDALGADLMLARQSGSGLPDIFETRGSRNTLRINLGGGQFAPAVPVPAPAQTRLSDEGSFLSDIHGDGYADWVVDGGARIYRAVAGGGFTSTSARLARPGVELEDPRAKLADLDGDGLPDVLMARVGGLFWVENLGDGGWAPPVLVAPSSPVRLDDPRVTLVDIDGDGIPDLVYTDGSGVVFYPGLGRGRFGEPVRLQDAPALGASFDPHAVQWIDLCGSGQASFVYVQGGQVRVAFNLAGRAFSPLIDVGFHRQSSRGRVEGVDLLGTGAQGLLFTDRAVSGPRWRFLELFADGQPDLLASIDNGIGGKTELTYGSSGAHWARDRARGRPWKTAMPHTERVVDRMTITDAVTGNRLQTEFRYSHGVYDGVEREFRGFARVETRDVEAPLGDPQPLPPTVTRRWYHTGLLLDHRDEWTALRQPPAEDLVPGLADARRALRSLLRREEVFAEDRVSDLPYVVTQTRYRVYPLSHSVADGRMSFVSLPIQKHTVHLERTRDERVVDTWTTYDLDAGGRGYGLAVEARERGYGRLGTFSTAHEQQQAATLERYTKTTYVARDVPEPEDPSGPYTPYYVVGKPSVEERWGVTGGGDVLLSRVRTFYDGPQYQGLGYPGSGTSLGVEKGLVSCRLEQVFTTASLAAAFPSGSGAQDAATARGHFLLDGSDHYVHVERTRYETNGQPLGTLDPNGHETTIQYETTHKLFPVLVVDAKGHPTELTRETLPQQVQALVDPNDNRTEFVYDPSGLPSSRSVMGKFVSGAWQGDPPTHPSEAYEYDFQTLPIRATTRIRQVRLGATLDLHRYIDGFGRTVQERHTAEPDLASPSTPRFRVTGWQIYNHKGLLVRAYQPVFSGSSAYASGSTSVPSIETLYDPLGRPFRVNHPDGTYETTDYHPWVQTARDRNDNAAGIGSTDPRYGAHLATFRGHLDTPTRKYVDAWGREIAVSEDNGAGVSPVFRVTTYEIGTGEFTGTTYDLTLHQNLAANYFVFIKGSVDSASAAPSNTGVRLTQDPAGTGDLAPSSAANILRLERTASAQGNWVGAVTVWECLSDPANAGFRLVDVKTVSFASTNSGNEQTTSVTSTAWTALSRVALYGGWGGPGATSAAATVSHQPLFAGFSPTGTATIQASRWRVGGTLEAASFTVFVVEWGAEHHIQRVEVTGASGGDALDAPSEWVTATLSAVRSAASWVWASGWTKPSSAENSFAAQAVTLGQGPSPMKDVVDKVAVGGEVSVDRKVQLTVHTHPSWVVHHLHKADGDDTVTSKDLAVTQVGETETYDETGTLRSTAGQRAALLTNSLGGSTTEMARATFYARPTTDTNVVAKRLRSGNAWVGYGQSIDTVAVTAPVAGAPALHVTRSVLDLKDQVTQVWDARGLSGASWTFEYDLRGQRTKAANSTGVGSRWSLADAAGNPIWSRDARGVEVDRTYDELNRPLLEESDDGTVKLRRKWTYVPYNDLDTASKSANLFGRVEEERDQDGLRFFEYDWRGLITKVSHRFWDADWQNASAVIYSNTDEAAIPSAARGSLSSWLVLTGLTDSTTVALSTTYDSAGRPTEEVWPEGTKRRWTYSAAGMPEKYEYDRGTGGGYEVAVKDATYNARGQITGYTHGNDVVCTREYDPVTERLLRIFARKTAGGEVRFQDLVYAYDPVGNPIQITDQLATSTFTANQLIPNTRTFRYDPRYRLIRSTGKRHKNATDGVDAPVTTSPSPLDYVPYTHRYSYDAVGNFTTNQEYKSGTNNLKYKAGLPDLFDGYGLESYSYDANGCCTATPRHQTLGYAFDAQPVFVDMGGGTKVRYRRHGDQRVLRLLAKSGVSGLGVYLGPWEYQRRTGTTAYTKTVLHVEGKSRHVQAERVLSGSDPDSLPVFHVHADHLGSAQALTKADGTLLCQEEFFAYGRSSDRRDARNRYRYVGVERDEDTGLSMTGPRLYDLVAGRFQSGDPSISESWSPYAYGRCTPLASRDSNGYEPTPPEDSPGETSNPETAVPPPPPAPTPPPAPFSQSSIASGAEVIQVPPEVKAAIKQAFDETMAGTAPPLVREDPAAKNFEYAVPFGWNPQGQPSIGRGQPTRSGGKVGVPASGGGIIHGHGPGLAAGPSQIDPSQGGLPSDEKSVLDMAESQGTGVIIASGTPAPGQMNTGMATATKEADGRVTVRMYKYDEATNTFTLYDTRVYEKGESGWKRVTIKPESKLKVTVPPLPAPRPPPPRP